MINNWRNDKKEKRSKKAKKRKNDEATRKRANKNGGK